MDLEAVAESGARYGKARCTNMSKPPRQVKLGLVPVKPKKVVLHKVVMRQVTPKKLPGNKPITAPEKQ
jgi:hypothetical protein